MDRPVRFDSGGGVGVLAIDRPEARNALTWEAMRLFAEAIESAHEQADVRCLIVTGNDQAFCAGGDLFELDGYPTLEDGARLSSLMADALHRLEALPVPTVAAIEGPALGGGAEIALACDLRVMAEGATLGMMHARLAIPPAWGGGQRLLRLVGYARALEWLTTGQVLSADEAQRHGLANRLVKPGAALAEAKALAASIAGIDPATSIALKRLVRDGARLPADEAMASERALFPALWAAPAHLKASKDFVARRNQRPVPKG